MKEEQNHKFETIDDMSPKVLKMFVFIKKQLMNPDHPLNVIAKRFAQSYVAYYVKEISLDVNQFNVKREQEFRVTQVTQLNVDN
jgi:hypothetical protein